MTTKKKSDTDLEQIRKIIVPILKRNDVVRAGILNVSSKASNAVR